MAPSLLERLSAAAWRALSAAAPHRWRLAAGAALGLLALETYKGLPLSYHVRLFALLLRYRFFPRRLVSLDTPIVSHSQVRLSDLDYHGHVNNAQYALDADLQARYPWIAAVLMAKGTPYRGNASIGTAVFFFLREMRWRAPYRIETRCVGIDEKWIYTESRWYLVGAAAAAGARAAAHAKRSGGAAASAGAMPEGEVAAARPTTMDISATAPHLRVSAAAAAPGDVLAAVKLTRFVLKESRGPLRGKTIPPSVAFQELGFVVPPSFSRAVRVGEFFTEAFELAIASDALSTVAAA